MAKYAYDKYGNFLYGANEETSPYYQSRIVAELVDYDSVRITWVQVVPDPSDLHPTNWALVKTLTGMPDTPYEGKIVTGGAVTQPSTSVVDTTNAVSYATEWYETFSTDVNVEVNYSLWVFNPAQGWINCGDSNTIVVDITTTTDLVSKWIPRAWQNSINGVGDEVGEYEYQDLLTALQAYALEYDNLRTKTTLLQYGNTPRYITTSLAKVRQLDFGFSNEAALGGPYYRSLAYSGDKINSLKGTIQGISEFIVGLTHIQNRVEIGHNLFLDYNDSSFEESLGQWKVNKLTSTGTTPTISPTWVAYTSTTHTAPGAQVLTNQMADAGSIPRSVGAMKLVLTGGASLALYPTSTTFSLDQISPINSISPTVVDNRTLIPVTPGLSYVFTGWIIGDPSTYSTVTPYISWFDYSGELIGSTMNSATVTAAAVSGTGSAAILTYQATNNFVTGQRVTVTGLTTATFNVVDALITFAQGDRFIISAVGITGTAITSGAAGVARGTIPNVPKTVTSSWQEFNSGSDMDLMVGSRMGVKAPANAAFALPMIKVTGNGTTYFDMFQLAEHHYSIEYQDARQINIFLRGQEENILPNPSFENATTSGWFANNATLDVVTGQANDGDLSLLITPTTTTPLNLLAPEELYTGPIVYSDWMPVDPNVGYTFTMYSNLGYWTQFAGKIGIEFSNQATEEKQGAITGYPGVEAYYYASTNYLVTTEIDTATYDATARQITLTFKTPPTGFNTHDYVSIKGMFSYPEMNVSGVQVTLLNDGVNITGATIYLSTPLLNTPDGATESNNAFLCLMYFDSNSSSYEDFVTYANITEEYIDLNTIDLTVTNGFSVTAVAPPYTKDSGMPFARVYMLPFVKPIGSLGYHGPMVVDGLRFSPSLLEDRYVQSTVTASTTSVLHIGGLYSGGTSGDLISSNQPKISDYFSGNGNATSVINTNFDPLTTKYFDPKFTIWESKITYNFVSNPVFDPMMMDMGWYGDANTTLTWNAMSSEGVSIPAGSSGLVGTQFTLPHPALGGEDVVVTMTVSGLTSANDGLTLTMTSPNMMGTGSTYIYTDGNSNTTQVISGVFQAMTGQMMNMMELQIVPTNTSLLNDTNIVIESATAEYGSTASAPFMPSEGYTLVNPMDPTMNLYAWYKDIPSDLTKSGVGISSYITNFPIKYNRLYANIKNYLPNGSTFNIIKGWPNKGITDLTESLIPSASFEKDLGQWSSTYSLITRMPYAGRYLDTLTHGIAYARVEATYSSQATGYFGIISENIPVDATKSYYGSVAVRPVAGTNAQGFYSLKVDAYKIDPAGDILLNTFNNRIEFYSSPLPLPGINFTNSSTAPTPTSNVSGDRWIDPNSVNSAEYTWIVNADQDPQSTATNIHGQWVEYDENLFYSPGTEGLVSEWYYISDTEPTNPTVGDRWFDTTTNIGYVYYDDLQSYESNGSTLSTTTKQWVELSVVYTQEDVYLDETFSPNWAYLNVIINKTDLQEITYTIPDQTEPSTTNADYVRVRVECSPDVYSSGQSFDVDRVVFRE